MNSTMPTEKPMSDAAPLPTAPEPRDRRCAEVNPAGLRCIYGAGHPIAYHLGFDDGNGEHRWPTAPEPTEFAALRAEAEEAIARSNPRNHDGLRITVRPHVILALLSAPSTAPAVVTPGLDTLLGAHETAVAHQVEALTRWGETSSAHWDAKVVVLAARTAIEAHVATLDEEREQARFAARYNADVAKQLDATRVELEAANVELRSTLSQIEGERDEATRVATQRGRVIQELQARVEGLMKSEAQAREDSTSWFARVETLVPQVAALTKQNETLRAAMRRATRTGINDEFRATLAEADEQSQTVETIVRHPNGHLAVERVPAYLPTKDEEDAALASLAKAWPVLAYHASHIDGEFDAALSKVRRMLAASRAALGSHDGGARHE